MKEEIRKRLEEVLPIVDFDSDFLFQELDSLGITTILMTLRICMVLNWTVKT